MKSICWSVFAVLLASTAVVVAADENSAHVRFEVHPEGKIFRWPELRAGDCHMLDATLFIRPNGVASFDANLWTHTHGTDVWHSTIHLIGQGVERSSSGNQDSPGIGHPQDGPDHRIHWHYDFNFPAQHFGAIDEAWEHGSC